MKILQIKKDDYQSLHEIPYLLDFIDGKQIIKIIPYDILVGLLFNSKLDARLNDFKKQWNDTFMHYGIKVFKDKILIFGFQSRTIMKSQLDLVSIRYSIYDEFIADMNKIEVQVPEMKMEEILIFEFPEVNLMGGFIPNDIFIKCMLKNIFAELYFNLNQ